MDQAKTGKLLARLRKQAGLTQEELGRQVGVTNKTVSRWENGNYMPDIETLDMLSQIYHISIHALLSGEITDSDSRADTDRDREKVRAESAFSFDERKAWLKRKWRREHIGLFALLALVWIGLIAAAILLKHAYLAGLAPVVLLMEYIWQNNQMMIYVENGLYGSPDFPGGNT